MTEAYSQSPESEWWNTVDSLFALFKPVCSDEEYQAVQFNVGNLYKAIHDGTYSFEEATKMLRNHSEVSHERDSARDAR